MDTHGPILLVVTPAVAMLVPAGFAIGFFVVGSVFISSVCDGISKIFPRHEKSSTDTAPSSAQGEQTTVSESDQATQGGNTVTPPVCAQCAFYVPSAGGPMEPYCTNYFVNSYREISVVTGEPSGHAPICEAARMPSGECGPEGKRFKRRDPRQKPQNGRG